MLQLAPDPTAWQTPRKLEEFLNHFTSVPALVIGDGPSRLDFPWDDARLDNIITVGCNRAGESYKPTLLCIGTVRWKQDGHLYDNRTVIATANYHEVIREGPVLVCNTAREITPLPPKLGWIRPAGKSGGAALHLAWSLGCNPIAIIGLDGYNWTGPKHAYEEQNKPQKPIPKIDMRQRPMQKLLLGAATAEGRKLYDLCPEPHGYNVFTRITPTQFLDICTTTLTQ